MELAALALFDKFKTGFSSTGGVARQFVGDMSKLTMDFSMDTRMYEAQLDSTDTKAFQTAVMGLQDRVNELLLQAAILEDKYQHSRASFDTILANMCQEIHDFTNQVSHHLCNKYKHHSFDRIALDHLYMDVMLFVCNVIQNICTFNALLTSHQLGWSVVPLQIMMALILTEAASTPCHLEFMEYSTEQSLHVQWSIRRPSATPVHRPAGINLESEQENPGNSRPKASDPDSPEMRPASRIDLPITPSNPPETPLKAEAMPLEAEVMPSKALDMPLKPLATPRKCILMPQKVVPSGSSNSAKDIMDRIKAKYGAGMSPQYWNVLALLTSGKGSEVTVPKDKEPSSKGEAKSDSDSDHKKAEPPSKKQKRDPGSGPEVADAGSGSSKKKSKKNMKKTPKSQKTISESKSSDDAGVISGAWTSRASMHTASGRVLSWTVLLPSTTRTTQTTSGNCYITTTNSG